MTSSLLGVLKPFDSSTDDFDSWTDLFGTFLIANGLDPVKEEKRCVAILLSMLGLPTYTLLTNLVSPDIPKDKTIKDLITVLKEHFKPAPRAIAERFKFSSRNQQQGESVNSFLAELRRLASTCKFADLNDRLRDQFICGLTSAATQRKLFTQKDDIDLASVVAMAKAQEAAEASTFLVRESQTQVHAQVHFTKSKGKTFSSAGFNNKKSGSEVSKSKVKSCPNCGSSAHFLVKDCPHKSAKCHNCGKLGHFAKLCRSKGQSPQTSKSKATHQIDNESVQCVNQVSTSHDSIMVQVQIQGSPHNMELDTGCRRSILSEDFWRDTLGAPPLRRTNLVFTTYTKEKFKARGLLHCKFSYQNQSINYELPVAKGTSLFGRDLLKVIRLDWSQVISQCNYVLSTKKTERLSLKNLLEEFRDVFDAPVGTIKDFKAKIVLRDGALPKFQKARPIPFALRAIVDRELDRMVDVGVIERIEHSDWASPLVVVPKPGGKVRITGDFKNTVNSQLCINQYPLTRVDELFSTITGGEKFSKLDGFDAFHQIQVDEAFKKFLVVNTHRGLYKYNVLPQGIASSPAIFQECMDKILHGIPMTGSFIDDGLCSGRNDTEHLDTLRKILQRMRDSNYRLSRDKCKFMQDSLEYLGHIISKDGILTAPSKVDAIMAIQEPQNVTEVKSFLGLVNFYGKFVPFLADKCESLYRLTRSNVTWEWTDKCRLAFQTVKSFLSSTEILAHHDQNLPIGISCDASPIGLGVVLFHKYPDDTERPIAFASKSLSTTERNYSQPEKEGLSIIYGIKKFYQYLCGRRFILVTDHDPLLSIFSTNRQLPPLTATRLHRWALFLSSFTYDISYRRTSDHGNADALSRFPMKDYCDLEEEIENDVNNLTSIQFDPLPVMARQVRQQSSRDGEISQIIRYVQDGWPKHSGSDSIQPYFVHRHELTMVQGILMWGLRVIIPKALRNKVLSSLHQTHAGIVRMKSLARQLVWWPGIDADIENLAKSCVNCAEHRANPPNAPLHPWAYPEKPWQRLHIDLAGPFYDNMWLVLMDAHSKWPEVFCLNNNSTSTSVVLRLRETFSRFGIPEHIVSDNGTQFTSAEFQDFCKSNGIRHSTSSAYHPRSNGEAERFVQTFKTSLKSSGRKDISISVQRFLLHYRITPHSTTGSSPAELLQGRKLRSLFDLIRPSVDEKVNQSQDRQTAKFNKNVKARHFSIGQRVWVQTHSRNEPKWSPGTIVSELGPVSFEVSVQDRKIKRHIDHILQAGSRDAKTCDSEDLFDLPTEQSAECHTPPQQSIVTQRESLASHTPPRAPILPIPLVLPESPAASHAAPQASGSPLETIIPLRRSKRDQKKPDRYSP